MKRFLILFTLVLFAIPCFSFSGFAVEYNTVIPSYVPYSGGAFFEVYDSNLGKVSCVFPVDYIDGTFGFNSGGTNIYNLTNSTVNGYVILSSGAVYTARASRFNCVEYRLSSNTSSYIALNPDLSTMQSTNIKFITTDQALYNDSYFDSENFKLVLLVVIAVSCVADVFISLLRRGYRL